MCSICIWNHSSSPQMSCHFVTIVTSAMPSLDGLEQVDPSPSEALLARVLWITIFSFGRPTNFLWAMASSMPIYGTFEWGKNGAMNLGSQLLEKSDIGGMRQICDPIVCHSLQHPPKSRWTGFLGPRICTWGYVMKQNCDDEGYIHGKLSR